jgi:hypothetical protein
MPAHDLQTVQAVRDQAKACAHDYTHNPGLTQHPGVIVDLYATIGRLCDILLEERAAKVDKPVLTLPKKR